MNNPFQTPSDTLHTSTSSSGWKETVAMFYWPAWSVGTALIVASWFDLVSVSLGWTGFAIAGLVTIASNILSASPQGESSQLVLLDSRMIHAKGDGYETGMRRFQNGSQLLFDGVIFQQMRHDELVCMVFAHATELDDDGATELASHAISAFDLLVAQCPEFADACRDRVFRISIMSSNDPNAVEMCRVVDGKLEWKC